jgi:hypothetical protein
MSTPLDVEKQRFTFGDSWTVAFKYDDSRFYRSGPERLKGELEERSNNESKIVSQATRAVDVIGLHQEDGLLLLEAKDFRGHRIENKNRLHRQIILEVALKTRDTVAGLLGAARSAVSEFPSGGLLAAMQAGQMVTVVLWIEDDTFLEEQKTKAVLNHLNGVLKEKLAWMNVRTLVQSSRAPIKLRDLTVTNLPGAGQPNP